MCEGQEPNSNSLKLDENSTVHRLKAFRVGLAWRMAGSGSFSLLFADLCFLVCARASRSACSLRMVGGGGGWRYRPSLCSTTRKTMCSASPADEPWEDSERLA